MILIIGGAYQGKLEYVKKSFGYTNNDISDSLYTDRTNKVVVKDFHIFVRKLLATGVDVSQYIENVLNKNDIKIIISDDIGQGVVPIGESERKWQDVCGRMLIKIAERAEKVIRVNCGLPEFIKGG